MHSSEGEQASERAYDKLGIEAIDTANSEFSCKTNGTEPRS